MQCNLFVHTFVAAIMALAALPAGPTTAHSFAVDQEAAGLPFGGYGIDASKGNTIGQEFRPTLSALDVVEIGLGPRDPNSFRLRVNIRDGALDGPVLGTSGLAVVQGGAPPMLPFFHFDFPSRVPLTPGNLYVIQPILDPPSGAVGFPFLNPGPYADGRAIIYGQIREDIDMLFRTGLSVPEPATATLFAICVMLAPRCSRRQRSTRRVSRGALSYGELR